MTSTIGFHPVRKILVGVDFTEVSDRALRAAFALAASAGNTQVHAAWVRSGLEGAPISAGKVARLDREIDRLRAHVDGVLAAWASEHGQPNIPEIAVHEATGHVAPALVELAAALDAGLIVVGTRGRRGLARAVLGSVAGDVLAKATCPVLVVRPIEHRSFETVPDVEAPCPDCAARRTATEGAELWCERHAERHPRAHVYGYSGPSTSSARPWGFS